MKGTDISRQSLLELKEFQKPVTMCTIEMDEFLSLVANKNQQLEVDFRGWTEEFGAVAT